MDDKLTIEIEKGNSEAIAKIWTASGVRMKPFAVADLVLELSKDLEITTGILPNGTRFYSGAKNNYNIGIQVPGAVRKVSFELNGQPEEYTIPFPDLFFIFKVVQMKIEATQLYACIPPIGRANDPLYHFPFGNVYDYGSVCWGNAKLPEIIEPVVLDGVVGRFFGAVFTGHLATGARMFEAPSGVGNLRMLLDYLSSKEHFPDTVLKSSGKTLGTAIAVRKD